MKKRLLSILLCLVMVLGLVPANTFAAETTTHTHCVCGKSDCAGGTGHDETTEWIGVSHLYDIKTSGNYYLTKNVTLDDRWLVTSDTANINLCLNGKTVTRTGNDSIHNTLIFIMNESVNLTITDCQKYAGKITRTNNNDGSTIYNMGTLTLWNGSISGNDSGVGVYTHGTFNLYGGSIKNNTNIREGGGVINDGTFNMTGGSVTGNVGKSCGGVFNRGTFNMTGGSITKNSGKGSSGGVYNIGTLNFSGTPVIANNTVDGVENNVYLRSDGKKVTVVGDGLQTGASVGLTGTVGKTVVTGTTSTTGFFLDNAGYDLVADGNGGLKLSVHNDHRICVESNCTNADHGNALTFKGINDLSEIKSDGSYYLKKDVVLDDMWVCLYNVNLCLNGKSIIGGTNKATVGVNYDKCLTITDCQETAGKITHKEGKGGSGIETYAGATLNFWNGCITGNTDGSGVYNKESTFNLYGGSITGNVTGAEGGGVLNTEGGKFNMYGGSITGNSATNSYGGGVYNSGFGTFNLYGGTISDNTSYSYGGGVYNGRTFNMYGGTISNNSARFGGGGINNSRTFTMTGGSITGNRAVGASSYGGGIYNSSNGTINMYGTPTVTGNNKGGQKAKDGSITGGKAENIYLPVGKAITVGTAGMENGASVGVSGTLGNTVVTGTTSTTGFFSDETDCLLKPDDNGGLKLVRDAAILGKLLVQKNGDEMADGKKTYDANAVVFANAGLKIGGAVVDDAAYTYTWQEKLENGTYNTLTGLAGSTGPANAGDYKLTVTATKNNEEMASATWSFTIEKAKLTVTLEVKDKVYDGTANAAVKIKDVVGKVEDDKITLGLQNEKFASANVGTNIAVTANLSITGESAKNYTAPQTLQGKASITPKALTVKAAAQNKIYDGTANATVKAELDPSGVVENDEVVLVTSGVTALFNNKNVGANKPVALTGSYALSGSAAGNYTLIQPAGLTAKVEKKELTIESLAVADKFYDGTNKATLSGTPTLCGAANGDEVALANGTPSFTGAATGKNIAVCFTEFLLSGADSGNYTLIQPNGITASINPYVSNKKEYKVNANNWLNTNFTVTAENGWLLSYTNTAEGEWVNALTASQENNNGTLRFYVRNKQSGIISEEITETYKIDKTAPIGEIRIDELNWWQRFVNTISFNLFYSKEQEVTVTASDNGSGVKTIEYLLTASDLSKEQLADKTFTEYKTPVGLEPDEKLIVYVKLTDNAGNVDYLRSDGIVLDATAPVINGAESGRTYCAAVTLTVTDNYLAAVTVNGKKAALTNGKLILEPAAGEQTVVATDEAGNSTTLAVTVQNGHTWGEWTQNNNNNTHTRTCLFNAAHTETASCYGGTATCQKKAVCKDCHQPYGSYGAHDWDTTVWGYVGADGHAHTCKTAGCTSKADFAAHTPGAAATETTAQTCTECGFEIAPALGHLCALHLTPVAEKAATCTAAGNTAYYKCACGKLYQDATASAKITNPESVVKNALGHDWAAATCTAPKTCKRTGCGVTEGAALGHSYANGWSQDKVYHWHACQNAGCSGKADFAAHTPGAAATETTAQTCTECGFEIAPALGHLCALHLTPVAEKAATCTAAGNTAYYKCACGKLYQDATASAQITNPESVIKNALGHDWAAATCAAPKTCKRTGCGATEGTALGHSYANGWSSDETGHWHACQNAGCTSKADFAAHTPGAAATETTAQTCTECGFVIAPALGHLCANHLTAVAKKAATGTAAGNTAYYKCACGKLYADATASAQITKEQTVIAAHNHHYEWKIEKEATAAEKGLKHQECTICHETKAAVEIPVTGKGSPKTGDSSRVGLWIALLFVSGAGVAGGAVCSKKKQKTK